MSFTKYEVLLSLEYSESGLQTSWQVLRSEHPVGHCYLYNYKRFQVVYYGKRFSLSHINFHLLAPHFNGAIS